MPHFNAPAKVIPANIRINFTAPETRGIILPDAEKRTIVSSLFWTQYRNVTNGRADRQTESFWLSQRCALQVPEPFLANVNVAMLSPVCLSVCLLSVTFVHPTQAIRMFGNVSTPFGTLATLTSR